jgi:hypothetical protein
VSASYVLSTIAGKKTKPYYSDRQKIKIMLEVVAIKV